MKDLKPVKVLLYGKRLKDVYPYASKWEVFKYKTAVAFRKVALGLIALTLIVLAIMALRQMFPVTVYQVQEKEVILDNLSLKVNELKGQVLADLKEGESRGHVESDGIIIFDSNNKASIGSYQFQKDTVIHYYKVLYGKDITGKDAVLIALDDQKAAELATDIIFKTDNGWRNWYNTSKKYGLPQKIDFIKSLSSTK